MIRGRDNQGKSVKWKVPGTEKIKVLDETRTEF
jgi:hypothetical protein